MKSAFSSKVMENELIVVDSISMDEYKTKEDCCNAQRNRS